MSANEQNRYSVLIVDPDATSVDGFKAILENTYDVVSVPDGTRALEIAGSEVPPDLVLSAVSLPDMAGHELCGRLRSREKTVHVPVLLVADPTDEFDAQKGLAAGAADFVTLPVHAALVSARVAWHLDLKRKQTLLEEYAEIDPLTELPNRRQFAETLEQEINRAGRALRGLSLVLVNPDHFQQYNETYGFGSGDQCLKRVAEILQNCLRRAGDFVARYEGASFAALLPYVTHEDAQHMATQIRTAIEDENIPHEASPVQQRVTASLGLATIPPEIEVTSGELLTAAEDALTRAKEAGGNTVEGMRL